MSYVSSLPAVGTRTMFPMPWRYAIIAKHMRGRQRDGSTIVYNGSCSPGFDEVVRLTARGTCSLLSCKHWKARCKPAKQATGARGVAARWYACLCRTVLSSMYWYILLCRLDCRLEWAHCRVVRIAEAVGTRVVVVEP